jgi:hypothetical protein
MMPRSQLSSAWRDWLRATRHLLHWLLVALDPRFGPRFEFVCVWCGQSTPEGTRFASDCCQHAARSYFVGRWS